MDSSVNQLKELCEIYLEKFNNRRNFCTRVSNAIDKENSKTKKLCLTLVKEIFANEKAPYCLFLNNKELSMKLLELLQQGIEEEIEFNSFQSEFFRLSIDLEFIYKISEFYAHYFSKNKEDYWGECIGLFVFEKNFKSEYINNLLNMINLKYNGTTYDYFLIKIKNKYNKSNQFQDELEKIFTPSEDKIENHDEVVDKEENSEKGIKKNGFSKSENEMTSQNSKLLIGQAISEQYESDTEKFNENNKINGNKIEKNDNNSNTMIDNNNNDNLELKLDKNNEINSNNEIENVIITNPEDNKNIANDGIEIIKIENTVINYFKTQLANYKIKFKKMVTPILIDIIHNFKIKLSNIGYYNRKNFDTLHKINDKTLSILINDKLQLKAEMCNSREYGYFCYKYKHPISKIKYYIEALYSIIDPIYLYNYCQLKDLIDDYNIPKSSIKNFYVKNRAMALEYYVNVSVFMDKYNLKPLPRIIYPLKNKNIDYDLLNEVEIDGAFFVENEFTIVDEDLPFIYQTFLSFSSSNKVYNIITSEFDLNGKIFKKNDLCLLEIKTEFPDKLEKDNRESFPEVLEKLFEKMIIYEQLFTSLKFNYDRIRVILFYELVLKKNFTNEINNAMKKFAKDHAKLKYLNKIYFQVIYVNASYFVGALRTNAEEIKNLKGIIENFKIESEIRENKIEELTRKNNEAIDMNNKLLIEVKQLTDKNNELLTKIENLESKIYE